MTLYNIPDIRFLLTELEWKGNRILVDFSLKAVQLSIRRGVGF